MSASSAPAAELREATAPAAGHAHVHAASASFVAGVFHVVCAESAAEGSAFLRLLGLLDPPAAGEVIVAGEPTRALDDKSRAELRSRRCGFVFTSPFLLHGFTVLENVAMPLFKVSQVGPDEARRRTEDVLAFVNLADFASQPVADLPPAIQFRVAFARALVNEPAIILVENPADNLADEDLHEFIALLRRAAVEHGVAIVVAASAAPPLLPGDQVLELAGGSLRCRPEIVPKP